MRSPTNPAVVYAEHDGTKLTGDLYLPKGRAKAPLLVAVHGGGWQAGSSRYYWYWGLFLARNGYAVFAIDYRTGKAGAYPAAVYDVKAAVQFVRAKAAEFDIDPDRIGLMGASSGGQLAALTALAGDQYTSAYRDDANAAVPADVKAVVGLLRRFRHAGAVDPRTDRTPARQSRRKIPRRLADAEPAHLFRSFADQLRYHGS